jgi:hypothetical protein
MSLLKLNTIKAHSAFYVKKGINMSELENGNGGGSTRSFG